MDQRNAGEQAEDAQELWQVPYLPIDPRDIGRDYQAIIRINSQSGKGGVAYILATEYGLDLPKHMHPEVGQVVNDAADAGSRELKPDEIHSLFRQHYVNLEAPLQIHSIERQDTNPSGDVHIVADISLDGSNLRVEGQGNGPISAFVDALERNKLKDFTLIDYRQHSIGSGSKTTAAAYIRIELADKTGFNGCGIDANIELAGLKALVSAFNRSKR
jgi:2-isopropylmalate synthase